MLYNTIPRTKLHPAVLWRWLWATVTNTRSSLVLLSTLQSPYKWKKLVHLQAMCTLGTPHILPWLEPIIQGKNKDDVDLRVSAIYCLSAEYLPKTAHSMVILASELSLTVAPLSCFLNIFNYVKPLYMVSLFVLFSKGNNNDMATAPSAPVFTLFRQWTFWCHSWITRQSFLRWEASPSSW